jgi:hypothetical protein
VIGPAPASDKVTLAFGHGHLGLSLAAITGKCVADLIAGRATAAPLEPFPSCPGLSRTSTSMQRRQRVIGAHRCRQPADVDRRDKPGDDDEIK